MTPEQREALLDAVIDCRQTAVQSVLAAGEQRASAIEADKVALRRVLDLLHEAVSE